MPRERFELDGASMGVLLRTMRRPATAVLQAWRRWRNSPRAQLLSNLSAVLAEDPVVTVEGYPGRFAIDARSDILRRVLVTGTYEPVLAQVCRDHVDPARDAIDVGANIGLYTLLLAGLLRGGRVLAIEPTPAALRRLRRNVSANGRDASVVIFAGAAGATNGKASITTVVGREEYSTLGALVHPSVQNAATESVEIAAQTIDSLVAEYALLPGFVKMDIEGMEHTVLDGMRSTLEKHRPVILAELSDPLLRRNGSSAREVLQQLRDYGYTLSDPLAPNMAAGMRQYGDVLCLPGRGRQ